MDLIKIKTNKIRALNASAFFSVPLLNQDGSPLDKDLAARSMCDRFLNSEHLRGIGPFGISFLVAKTNDHPNVKIGLVNFLCAQAVSWFTRSAYGKMMGWFGWYSVETDEIVANQGIPELWVFAIQGR
jgi:hypothetical protein